MFSFDSFKFTCSIFYLYLFIYLIFLLSRCVNKRFKFVTVRPITNLYNSILGFPFQRGRLHMAHIPSLGYSHCQVIRFEPFVFYPDKPIEVQITVNHMDTSDKSYVHDAAVSWIENVNNGGFTACVMAAGYNERKSYANVTVDWMAYQGAPLGGVTGEMRMSQWWTGTTCAAVKFPTVSYIHLFFNALFSKAFMIINIIRLNF